MCCFLFPGMIQEDLVRLLMRKDGFKDARWRMAFDSMSFHFGLDEGWG